MDRKASRDRVASGRRVASLASFLDPNPVDSLRVRLDQISRSITAAKPQAAQLIHLNRVLDTAEALLYLPRVAKGFEESVIASGWEYEPESITSDVQSNSDEVQPPAIVEAVTEGFEDPNENTRSISVNHSPVRPINPQEYPTSVAVEEILSQLGHLTTEMEKRAEESSHLGELVTAWRGEIIRELQGLKEQYTEAHEKSLAELRYLRHKVDYLEERTANILDTSAASSPRRFREPVVAELVETIGISPRFSSLASSYHSEGGSPRMIRRQFERTRQETEMINNSISERKDLVEQRVKALDLE